MVPALRPTAAFVLTFCFSVSCARRYPVDALVLRVDRPRQTLLVSHKDIPGLMPAMVMPVRMRDPRAVAGLEPGRRVRFDLHIARGESWAHNVRLLSPRLQDVVLPPARPLPLGAVVPDFALTDQLGRPARLSDFRGRPVVLNFIYTRCPLPEVCPRLSAHFARLQRRFGPRLALISITLDPQHDTPAILAGYAKTWRADPACWRFLTGPLPEVRSVSAGFGLLFWAEDGAIAHTSQTALIAADGRLLAIIEGTDHTFGQLADLVATYLEGH